MEHQEGFSVLVPAFNEEDSIEKFLNDLLSALKGTDREHEVIVIDDGSTDQTYSISKKFPDVRVVRHPYRLWGLRKDRRARGKRRNYCYH